MTCPSNVGQPFRNKRDPRVLPRHSSGGSYYYPCRRSIEANVRSLSRSILLPEVFAGNRSCQYSLIYSFQDLTLAIHNINYCSSLFVFKHYQFVQPLNSKIATSVVFVAGHFVIVNTFCLPKATFYFVKNVSASKLLLMIDLVLFVYLASVLKRGRKLI